MKRRIASMLTALALCLSILPTWALAAEEVAEDNAPPDYEQQEERPEEDAEEIPKEIPDKTIEEPLDEIPEETATELQQTVTPRAGETISTQPGFVFANGIPIVIQQDSSGATRVCNESGAPLCDDDITGWIVLGGWCGGDTQYDDTSVTMKSGTVNFICGGSYNADLSGNSHVDFQDGTINFIFGGGWNGNVEGNTYLEVNDGQATQVYGGGWGGTVNGNTNLTLNGGSIGWAYGGGFTSGVSGTATVTINRGASVLGNQLFDPSADGKGNVSGGGLGGTVQNTMVIYNGGDVGSIFGGGENQTDQDGNVISAGDCTNTNVKILGALDEESDGMTVYGGGFGCSVESATIEFRGVANNSRNQSMNIFGNGYGDNVENVKFIIGGKSTPGSIEFFAGNPFDPTSTANNAEYEIEVSGIGPNTAPKIACLDGSGAAGTVSVLLKGTGDVSDTYAVTDMKNVNEITIQHCRVSLATTDSPAALHLNRLELDNGAAVLTNLKDISFRELISDNGSICIERLQPVELGPVKVDTLTAETPILIERGGGLITDAQWKEMVLFSGPAIDGLENASLFTSALSQYIPVKTGKGIQMKDADARKGTYLYNPRFDKPSYQYGDTMEATVSLMEVPSTEINPIPGKRIEILAGPASPYQLVGYGITDENGQVIISIPIDDGLWRAKDYGLQAHFRGDDEYLENFYGLSLEGGGMPFEITPAAIRLTGQITAPALGAVPSETFAVDPDTFYTAQVLWSPADATFHMDTAYTAVIQLIPKDGYSLDEDKISGVTYQGQPLTGTLAADGSLLLEGITFDPLPGLRLTVSASPAAGGTVTGSGAYEPDSQVTVRAEAAEGYVFHQWTEAGAKVSADAEYTFTLTDNRSLTAVFLREGTVTLTPSAETLLGGGKVTLTLSGLPAGGEAALSCSDSSVSLTQESEDTWTADLPNRTGEYTFTVLCTGGGATEASASCSISVREAVILPEPPENSGEELRLVMEAGLPAVPEDLAGIEDYNTPEKIESALQTAVRETLTSVGENIAVYDVTLQYKDSSGQWRNVDPDDFPSDGVTTALPYPDGTGANPSGYTFTVQHLISSGGSAGTMETIPHTLAADGLQCTFTSLSPVAVGYQLNAQPAPNPPAGSGSSKHTSGAAAAYDVTVKKASHGTVSASRATASSGTAVTLAVTPDDGYELESLTVTDSKGNEIRVTGKNGKFTFTMPARAVTVEARFTPYPENEEHSTVCPSRAFYDLDTTEWYHEAVDFVLDNGLMNGTSSGFAPNAPLSRAMLTQILWNHAGKPSAAARSSFPDVPAGEWYTDAVDWAAAQGIVSGGTDGRFAPNDSVTREQLAVMLWRYAGSPAGNQPLTFVDTDSAGSYALDALRWAVGSGILNGKSGSRLDPTGPASRSEAAQMLYHFWKN